MPLLLLCILLLLPSAAFAQVEEQETTVIEATVVDAETGEPLPFASISVVPPRHASTITNAEGGFRIAVMEGDKLRFTYAGYQSLTLSPKAVGRKVKLKPATLMISEVNVKALPLKEIRKETLRQKKKHRRKTADYYYRQTANSFSRRPDYDAALPELWRYRYVPQGLP